jgi:hypothetical protein
MQPSLAPYHYTACIIGYTGARAKHPTQAPAARQAARLQTQGYGGQIWCLPPCSIKRRLPTCELSDSHPSSSQPAAPHVENPVSRSLSSRATSFPASFCRALVGTLGSERRRREGIRPLLILAGQPNRQALAPNGRKCWFRGGGSPLLSSADAACAGSVRWCTSVLRCNPVIHSLAALSNVGLKCIRAAQFDESSLGTCGLKAVR